MIIIYHDFAGTHSTIVAANLHLKKIAATPIPSKEQLMDLPMYETGEQVDIGTIKLWGEDVHGHKICTLGRKNIEKLMLPALTDLNFLLTNNPDNLLFVNTMHSVNIYMKIGGFLSRKLKLTWLGRPLVIYGTQKAFAKITKLVMNVQNSLNTPLTPID
jgi:hypothetical protein